MQSIAELWRSPDQAAWRQALERYWQYVQPRNLELERALERLDLERIRNLEPEGWYDFLRNQYFRWKYTAPNRYATTTRSLAAYVDQTGGLDELHSIKFRLLELDVSKIREGLLIACEIRGLGVAGASGLLSLLYPPAFATVDQFAVKALRLVGGLPEDDILARMKPESLSIANGVNLIGLMRRKSAENNQLFETTEWTPRKIDQILWTYGR